MKAEIEEQINEIIEAAKSAGADTVEFLKQQSPDYFSQLIKWFLWDGVLDIFKGVFWVIVSLAVADNWLPAVWQWWANGQPDNDRWIGFSIATALVTICLIASIFTISGGVTQMLKAIVAPKVIIVNEIKSVLQSRSDEDDD